MKRPVVYNANAKKNIETKMEHRIISAPEYHTSKWTKLSREFRNSHPLCEECKRQGKITPAQVVDHIIPIFIYADFWDKNNWQSLCRRCNIIKGSKDRMKYKNK